MHINGERIVNDILTDPKTYDNVYVYASNDWYEPADGTISNLCYQSNIQALSLLQGTCTTETCNVHTHGIFAIWWEKDSDYLFGATELGNFLNRIRGDLLQNYGLTVSKENDIHKFKIHNITLSS